MDKKKYESKRYRSDDELKIIYSSQYYNIELDDENIIQPLVNQQITNTYISFTNNWNGYDFVNSVVPLLQPPLQQPVAQNLQFEEDVLVTLGDKDLDNLKTKSATKDMERCTICLMDIDEGEKIIELDCKHSYHTLCLTQYLTNYGYKCPICRKEVGESKAHIV